jgi:hypothetical protein
LLKRVIAGAAPGDITEGFLRYRKIKVKGVYVESPGLTRRRENEARLFNTPDDAAVSIDGVGNVSVAARPAPSAPVPSAPVPSAPEAPLPAPLPPEPSPGSVSYPGAPTTAGPDMPQDPRAQPPKPLPQSRTLWGVILVAIAGLAQFAKDLWGAALALWRACERALGFSPGWILLALFLVGLIIVIYARLTDQKRRTR